MKKIALFLLAMLAPLSGCNSLNPFKIVQSWNLRGDGLDKDDSTGLNSETFRQESDDEAGYRLGWSKEAQDIERRLGR